MKVLSATLALLSCIGLAAADRVELLDSSQVEGRVASVTDKAVSIVRDGGPKVVELRDVAEISLAGADDVMSQPGRCVLRTVAGDTFAVSDVSVEAGHISFTTPALGHVRIPLAAAAVYYQPDAKTTAEDSQRKCAEMKLAASAGDLLVVAKEKADWLTVTGLLKAMGKDAIDFRWNDADRKVGRDSVRVIFFGKVSAEPPSRAGWITSRDGSVFGFQAVRLEADSVVVRLAGIGEKRFPRDQLASVRFESDRVVRLGDLKPAKAEEYGLFKTFAHRVDRSVGGGPLSLGGRQYAAGLGLHSYCRLDYGLSGRFATFVAVVGIDDSVRPAGDAILTILGDGRPIGAPVRLTGKDEPKTLRLDVSKVRVLSIRVDFGEQGLDAGDHVDIAAARLIR